MPAAITRIIPALIGASLLVALPARAQLALTPDAVAKGFTLSLFVDQVPATGYCCGPLGIATNSQGQVVMQSYAAGRNVVFANVDGQHYGGNLSSAPYVSNSYGAAITSSGGKLYATNNDAGGVIYRLKDDGSIDTAITGAGAGGHGLWTNPVTGHLVAATGSVINDIDPTTGSFSSIVSGFDVDGVSVSQDGKTIYGATGGRVLGWNYSGAIVYDSGGLGSPDGTGVIQGKTLFSGDIVANDNGGNLWLLDPVKNTSVVIATGGSRGDYVGLDGTNGSLFLTQTDRVYRLSCGKECFFTPPTPAPEPSTYLLMALGLGGIGWKATRRAGRFGLQWRKRLTG